MIFKSILVSFIGVIWLCMYFKYLKNPHFFLIDFKFFDVSNLVKEDLILNKISIIRVITYIFQSLFIQCF